MADEITWGHALMLAGLVAGLIAVVHVLRWFRQRDHGRGTPQYADGRLARRSALYALAIAVILFAAGCLTPLCENSDRMKLVRALILVPALAGLSACATQSAQGVAAEAPGFLLGLWHGFIFPVAWILSLFIDTVAIYAVPNEGGWYDFGYFLGVAVFGVGARKSHVVYRDRGASAR